MFAVKLAISLTDIINWSKNLRNIGALEAVNKTHGAKSRPLKVPGGGPQGGYLGIMEYRAQSNTSATCEENNFKLKFVDHLPILEHIKLLMVGIYVYVYIYIYVWHPIM